MRHLGSRLGALVLVLSPVVAGGPARAQAPPEPVQVTRGPYLQSLLHTSALVVWRTDAPSTGKVTYGPVGGPLRVNREAAPELAHRVMLRDLSPGTMHLYQIHDGDRPLSAELTFRTAPLAAEDVLVRAAVLGDSGSGTADQLAVAALLKGLAPDIILHTGDMDYLGDPDRSVFSPYRELLSRSCLYPAMGNHDEDLEWGDLLFPPVGNRDPASTYYSFDWGSAHFVALDTNDNFEGAAQTDWLEEDLRSAQARGMPWIVLYFHKPAYTVGAYVWLQAEIRKRIAPIADRFGVDLVLNGHDHNYQRTHPVEGEVVRDAWQSPRFVLPRGTIYVVSGGGGRSLYAETEAADHRYSARFIPAYHALELTITSRRLAVRALGPAGDLLDEFTISKEGARPAVELLRGDADLSGRLDLSDPIRILLHLFAGADLPCPLAARLGADADGSGPPPDLTDAVYLLSHLYLGGPPPPPPFPACGVVAGADDAWCTRLGCRA